ncbi:MAG: methylmalonyl Co-A mutase-associated GTPase MeaB [Gaiella sp.]
MAKTASAIGELADGVLAGDRRALARAATFVENRDPGLGELMARIFPATGRGVTVGITGASGVGKSTLASALVKSLRDAGLRIGVVSVDPTSPFTHGALLGDRVRMAEHFTDKEVFIRSMGTRGHGGGLAAATGLVAALLDAAGKDVVLVETVGVGQGEVEVIGVVDLVVLVLNPGGGDGVQALKAGAMEIPDVIAVNKRSHPQAALTVSELQAAIALEPDHAKRPVIVECEALDGEGIDELWAALERRRSDLEGDGRLAARRRRGLERQVVTLAVEQVRCDAETAVSRDPALAQALNDVAARRLDPYSAAEQVLSVLSRHQ